MHHRGILSFALIWWTLSFVCYKKWRPSFLFWNLCFNVCFILMKMSNMKQEGLVHHLSKSEQDLSSSVWHCSGTNPKRKIMGRNYLTIQREKWQGWGPTLPPLEGKGGGKYTNEEKIKCRNGWKQFIRNWYKHFMPSLLIRVSLAKAACFSSIMVFAYLFTRKKLWK